MAWTADSATIATASTSASQVSHGDRRTTRKATPSMRSPKAPNTARPRGDVSIHGYSRIPSNWTSSNPADGVRRRSPRLGTRQVRGVWEGVRIMPGLCTYGPMVSSVPGSDHRTRPNSAIAPPCSFGWRRHSSRLIALLCRGLVSCTGGPDVAHRLDRHSLFHHDTASGGPARGDTRYGRAAVVARL